MFETFLAGLPVRIVRFLEQQPRGVVERFAEAAVKHGRVVSASGGKRSLALGGTEARYADKPDQSDQATHELELNELGSTGLSRN